MSLTDLRLLHNQPRPLLYWGISIIFVLFQFFIQLSSGLVVNSIMKDLALTASEAGLLASAYYYVYTSLQIPVGMLFDRQSTRLLLAVNASLCAIGCYLFSEAVTFAQLMWTRLMIGAGSAFAFIGVSHILRQYFSYASFGLMIGISETLAFLVTVFFMLVIGVMSTEIHWRSLMLNLSYCGLVITLLCLTLLPHQRPKASSSVSVWHALSLLCKNPIAWINNFYVAVGFGFITVFGAMWAIPFIQLKLGCSIKTASILDACLFLGTGLSCPLFGELDNRCSKRSWILCSSYAGTALLLFVTLWVPLSNPWIMGALLFLMGLISGAYMLTYTIANEISPAGASSTSAGFTNTFAVLSAPILQPFIGWLLDHLKQGSAYTIENYQTALMIIPISLILGGLVSFLLPEKNCRNIT